MVWGSFSWKRTSTLAFLKGKVNAQRFINVLEEHLLSFGTEKYGGHRNFQQDGASIHTAGTVNAWFESHNINVLPLPSRSPDLNPIENLWSILARLVYEDARQFGSVDDLTACIKEKWASLT